ncbi:MAG TPA: hypothetical protein VFE58_15710 [Tepidisphaeraceae bacterium]|jgi:hypothetical protein|nr:hypothetical protein [Tepidisphaeraceae bacterium]
MNEDVIVRLAGMGDAEVIAGFNVEMAWETEEVRLEPVVGLAGVRAALGDGDDVLCGDAGDFWGEEVLATD